MHDVIFYLVEMLKKMIIDPNYNDLDEIFYDHHDELTYEEEQ
jgi:hypothetical protein